MGPPGAGKGTQAELLADRLGLYHLETSRLLEAAFNSPNTENIIKIKGETFSLKKEKMFWKSGKICSPLFVAGLISRKIKFLADMDQGIVFSGSPRSMEEARETLPLLEKLYGRRNIRAFVLNVPAEETIFRNSHRRICLLMRHPILYSEETKNLKFCPLDGSKLIRRKGLDDPKVIKVRLATYKEVTFPVIEYLKESKIPVKEINGVGSVSAVFQRLERALK